MLRDSTVVAVVAVIPGGGGGGGEAVETMGTRSHISEARDEPVDNTCSCKGRYKLQEANINHSILLALIMKNSKLYLKRKFSGRHHFQSFKHWTVRLKESNGLNHLTQIPCLQSGFTSR